MATYFRVTHPLLNTLCVSFNCQKDNNTICLSLCVDLFVAMVNDFLLPRWCLLTILYLFTQLIEHSPQVTGSQDQTSSMDLILGFLPFQSYPQDRCTKGCVMYYAVNEMVLSMKKNSPQSAGSRFPLSLSVWSLAI